MTQSEELIISILEKHGFEVVNDVEDGAYFYTPGSPDAGTVLLMPFLRDIDQAISSAKEEERMKISSNLEEQSEYWIERFKSSRVGTNENYLERSTFLGNLAKEIQKG